MLEASDAAFIAGISNRAYRVLMEMARRAKDHGTDDEPGRHYYGGHRHLAQRLGYDVTDEPLSAAARSGVTRALAELVAAKLVEVVGSSGINRSVYHLRLFTSRAYPGG